MFFFSAFVFVQTIFFIFIWLKFLRATAHAVFLVVLYILLSCWALVLSSGMGDDEREERESWCSYQPRRAPRVFNCVCVCLKLIFFLGGMRNTLKLRSWWIESIFTYTARLLLLLGLPGCAVALFSTPLSLFFFFLMDGPFFGVCHYAHTSKWATLFGRTLANPRDKLCTRWMTRSSSRQPQKVAEERETEPSSSLWWTRERVTAYRDNDDGILGVYNLLPSSPWLSI